MADKLAEIKQALEHHDSGAADWKRLDEQHPGAAKFADELQVTISADAARALLSVVEAVAKLIDIEERDEDSTEEYFALKALLAKLKE